MIELIDLIYLIIGALFTLAVHWGEDESGLSSFVIVWVAWPMYLYIGLAGSDDPRKDRRA